MSQPPPPSAALGLGDRARRALRRLPPSADEVRWYLWGALLPLLPLLAFRLSIRRSSSIPWTAYDTKMLLFGEAQQWVLASGVAWLFARTLGRWTPRLSAGVWLGFALTLCLACAADLAFFQSTGTRADWEVLIYALRDLPRALPVAASEMSPARWGLLGLLCAVALVPAAMRAPQRGLWGWRALWVVLLLLCADEVPVPKGRYTRLSRDMRDPLLNTLGLDAIDRYYDQPLPPPPERFLPLEVGPAPAAAGIRPPNIVIVVLESVNAQSTTPYTFFLQTTPVLDRLAREGLLVDDMTAVLPHTTKGLVSVICGQWPYPTTEVFEARPDGLISPCLPTLLREAGYRSAFFQTARGDFEDRVGLTHNMGFDRFLPLKVIEHQGWDKNNYFGVDDLGMIGPGVAWAASAPELPFLSVYLTLASHHEYKTPAHWGKGLFKPYRGTRGRYLNGVNYGDHVLGELIAAHEAAGLLDNTVFVIIGDHGEGVGEHGRWQHDLVIYEEGLRIPAVLWGPSVLSRTGVIEGARQQIDVLPTVLELAGLEVTAGATVGSSLLHPVDADRRLYHTCFRPGRCSADRVGQDKFIELYRDGSPKRFDLAADPGERTNLIPAGPLSPALVDRRDGVERWRKELLGRYLAEPERAAAARTRSGAPAVATWGGAVSMLGCAPWTGEAAPGEVSFLRCNWRLEVDEALRLRPVVRVSRGAQKIELPSAGALAEPPIWTWSQGEDVGFDLRFSVPARLDGGPLPIEVAWRGADGKLLPRAGAEDPWAPVGALTVVPVPDATPPVKKLPPPRGRPEVDEDEEEGEGEGDEEG